MKPRTLKRVVGALRVAVGLGFVAGVVLAPTAAWVALVAALAQQPGLYAVLSAAVLACVACIVVALGCAAADASLVQCETRLRRW